MSRTFNTLPFNVIKDKIGEKHWKISSGYPPAVGGAWPGRKRYARYRNRQLRHKARLALQQDKELIPKLVKTVSWDVW